MCSFLPKKMKNYEQLFHEFLPILDHSDHLVFKKEGKGFRNKQISVSILLYVFTAPSWRDTASTTSISSFVEN